MFRGIERVWQGDRESLGLVLLPQSLEHDCGDHVFPPALLDACLQAVIPADGDFDHRNGGLYLPHEIEAVRLFRRPGRRVWVHARLLEKTPRRSRSDVDIYNEDGQLAVRLRELRSHRVAGGREDSLDELLYAYQWRIQPRPNVEIARQPGRWLILADEAGVGSRLEDELRARGDACVIARVGSSFRDCGHGDYRVDPSRPEDMVRLIQAVSGPDQSPCQGIVHLWNLDTAATAGLSTDGLKAAQERGLLSIVWLVQAWDRVASDRTVRLFLVTRGAQSVADRPEPAAIAQSPTIGLGRVIAGECPRVRCRLVDLDPAAVDAGVGSLVDEVFSADDEDEVAVRGLERYVHRYLPARVCRMRVNEARPSPAHPSA